MLLEFRQELLYIPSGIDDQADHSDLLWTVFKEVVKGLVKALVEVGNLKVYGLNKVVNNKHEWLHLRSFGHRMGVHPQSPAANL